MSTSSALSPAGTVIKTLLLTDLVDSTRLFERIGDRRSNEVSAAHDRLARDLLVEFGGLEIDKTDGFLFLFERRLSSALGSATGRPLRSSWTTTRPTATFPRCYYLLGRPQEGLGTPEAKDSYRAFVSMRQAGAESDELAEARRRLAALETAANGRAEAGAEGRNDPS